VTLTRLAHAVMLANGWRRAAIMFIAGAASALALAPVNAWPILFMTFPVLVWAVDGAADERYSGALAAAISGWWFGFGYFLAGLYWVGYAFLVDAKTFGWLLPVAVGGLPAVLAVYMAVGLGLARLLWRRGPDRVLVLALTLSVTEWLRGHLFSGFPWNTFGYALTEPLILAQAVALIGVGGLTFLTVAICASPAMLVDDRLDTPYPWRWPVIGVLILAALGLLITA
jgi:apolipoprotein N-acyltransferase